MKPVTDRLVSFRARKKKLAAMKKGAAPKGKARPKALSSPEPEKKKEKKKDESLGTWCLKVVLELFLR